MLELSKQINEDLRIARAIKQREQASKKAMKLSYARLSLVEEALRQYFGNKASDWVCSTDEQTALTRNEVISFFEEVIDQRAAASWSD